MENEHVNLNTIAPMVYTDLSDCAVMWRDVVPFASDIPRMNGKHMHVCERRAHPTGFHECQCGARILSKHIKRNGAQHHDRAE